MLFFFARNAQPFQALSPWLLCMSGSSQISSLDVRKMARTGSLSAALIYPITRGTTASPNRARRLWQTNAFNMQNESMLKPAAWGKLSGCHSTCGSSAVQKMVYWTWGGRQINLGTRSTLQLDSCNLFPLQGPFSISLWATRRSCLEEETMFRNSFLWFWEYRNTLKRQLYDLIYTLTHV